MKTTCAIAVASVLTCGCAAADTFDVPIRRDALRQSASSPAIASYYFSVPIRVGSTSLSAILDTGSTGLRVLPHQVSPNDTCQKRAEHHEQVTFGSGIVLDGISATTDLALASHPLGGPGGPGCHAPRMAASLQLVRFGSCATADGPCPLRTERFSEFRFGGEGRAYVGDPAILGLRARLQPNPTTEVVNPLKETGHRQYIVDLPRREGHVGRLTVDPNQMQTRGFKRLTAASAKYPQAPGGTVIGCLLGPQGGPPPFCGPMLFDSGASGVSIKPLGEQPTGCRTVRPYAKGSTLTIRFMDETGKNSASETFKVGIEPYAHVTASCANIPHPSISLGQLPYIAFSVLVDAQQQTTAVRARPDPLPDGPTGATSE